MLFVCEMQFKFRAMTMLVQSASVVLLPSSGPAAPQNLCCNVKHPQHCLCTSPYAPPIPSFQENYVHTVNIVKQREGNSINHFKNQLDINIFWLRHHPQSEDHGVQLGHGSGFPYFHRYEIK